MNYQDLVDQLVVAPPDEGARIAALRNQRLVGQLGQLADIGGINRSAAGVSNAAERDLADIRSGGVGLKRALAMSGIDSDRQRQEMSRKKFAYQQMYDAQRMELDRQRMAQSASLAQQRMAMQQAAASRPRDPLVNLNLGSIPGGYERVMTEQGPLDRPLRGSKEYMKTQGALQGMQAGVEQVKEMEQLIGEHGSEMYGPTSGKMQQAYGDILALVAKARNMGVLQTGELDMLQSQLTNPGSMAAAATGTDTMLSQYAALRNTLEGRLADAQSKMQQWGYAPPEQAAAVEAIDLTPGMEAPPPVASSAVAPPAEPPTVASSVVAPPMGSRFPESWGASR